jgi:predicted CXXCH cytochrome family protein
MRQRSAMLRRSLGLTFALVLATTLAGCLGGDDRIVYRDRTFPEPPTGAAGFLGYDDASSKLTVCGNCHVGQQAQWEDSPHASAFATLQGSGGMQDFCQSCHTVTDLGNTLTTTNVGWNATKDVRYHDVQCESCHGPGLQHVTNPDASQPLASIKADTLATTGCGDCHSGAHHPFVAEWQRSAHGRLVSSSTATTSASCIGCHTAQGVLARWGETANYVEKGGPALPQTCAVCHDPHGSPNAGQLRYPVDTPDEQANLCVQCHNRRATPDPASAASGPHAPEGPIVLGFAGWWAPAMEFTPGDSAFLASHGSARNPRLCATCHVERFTVRDTLTKAFMLEVVGHQFLATPCVNANGIPTGSTSCTKAERRYESCAGSGCHTSAASARGLHSLAESRIDDLVVRLDALIARIPANQFSNTDGRYTTGEGSKFNSSLAKTTGAEVHNPFLIEALLRASIVQIGRDYGLTSAVELPAATRAMQDMLDRASHRAGYQQVKGR